MQRRVSDVAADEGAQPGVDSGRLWTGRVGAASARSSLPGDGLRAGPTHQHRGDLTYHDTELRTRMANLSYTEYYTVNTRVRLGGLKRPLSQVFVTT